ncbi:stonustoxin subunit beta-like [Acipenser oxyrinchus oxyrinchus]|uniref:Stonustoxin subunit beta-like n=1 Tax=Acipenser oxyrinchus oxyrinchus TaxID=40147 RepID=A0AAD8CPG6_ACIOX|nr:stonustoxin subunit beta-like [Acipenser oxyrinchus oxyrinchus]
MDSPIEMAALGRALFPGMLYDCRNDSFIPGVTLWDSKALKNGLSIHEKPSSDFKISTSNSLKEKSNLLDVSASLKASFLGGLIEVGGSAKYLKNDVSSTRQCRVTMKYSKTVRYEQLTMSQLGKITYPQVFEQKTATHVITGVLYGAQAFLVFDQSASKDESKQDIEGTLNVMVKKIPSLSIEGEGALKLTDEEKKTADKFDCTFHGDFEIKQNPTTFLEAINVYKTLPELLGEKGEKAVPVRVWLYPLIKLDSKAAQLVREISVGLVSHVEAVLELLRKVNMRVNDLIGDSLLDRFVDLKDKLVEFQDKFQQYKAVFEKAVSRVLPAIRGGGEEEQALFDILQHYNTSPFTQSKMDKWLDEKKGEIKVLRRYADGLKDVPIMTTWELHGVLFDPEIETVVCFTFTSLQYEEPYLSTLTQCLESEEFKKLEKNYSFSPKEESQPWFTSPELSRTMRRNLELFRGISEASKNQTKTKFIVVSISDPSCPGASIRLYRRGKIVDPQFRCISKPQSPEVTDIQTNSVTLKLLPSQAGKSEWYRVEHRAVKRAAETDTEQEWTVTDTPDTQETWTLTGLQVATLYQVRYRAVEAFLMSKASEAIEIQTKPSPRSAPGKPSVERVGHSSVRVSWKKPAAVEGGLSVLQYRVEYKNSKQALWSSQLTEGNETVCTVEGMEFTEPCRVRVYSVFAEGTLSAASEETAVKEVPEPRTRDEFLYYSCRLTLDPNTAHRKLCLSERNRKVTFSRTPQPYPDHTERFQQILNVLCREGLSGTRCYWEIERSGREWGADIGVTYKGISRKGGGNLCILGNNDKSWILHCSGSSYSARHNNKVTAIPALPSLRTEITACPFPRIGVYLDFTVGSLSFYGVSGDTMTLLHRFQTTFTEKLYPGFWVHSNVTICELQG